MSSATMSSSPTQQAPIIASQFNPTKDYRQTTYQDGRGCQIVESCSRGRSLRDMISGEAPRSGRSPSSSIDTARCDRQEASFHLKAYPSFASSSRLAAHVTDVNPRPRRSKPMVIVAKDPGKAVENAATTSFKEDRAQLTPPPTPRISRLPTPDLPDLDDRPFCDCHAEMHVIKYCTSCCRKINPGCC